MAPYTIILAGTSQEGSRYARRAGLPRGRWRVAVDANSIRGLRSAEIHRLPSFGRRRDRHAIEAELRYGRHQVIEVEMPTPAPVDQGDGFGEQLSLEDLEPVGYDGMGAPLYEHQVDESTEIVATVEEIEAKDRVSIMQAMAEEAEEAEEAIKQRQVEALERGMPTPLVAQIGTDESGDPVAPIKKPRKPRTPKPAPTPAAPVVNPFVD